MDTVSARLKEILAIRGITQKDLVAMAAPICKEKGLKLSTSKLNQYVTGKSRPDVPMIMLMAEVLEVNPAWLDGWDAPMKPITPTSEASTDERMEVIKDIFPRLTQFEQRQIVAEMEKKASKL